jgi:aminopeptidase-like protein
MYPTLGARGIESSVDDLLNVLAYSDGETDLLQIAETCGISFATAHRAAQRLLGENLLRLAD